MNANLSSGSRGSSAAGPLKSAMLPVLIGIALIMLVSKTAGLLAVAVICYMIIYLEQIGGSSQSLMVGNESLCSGQGLSEDRLLMLESQEQRPGRPSKTNQQIKSPLFCTIPAELRMLIYRELFISKSGGKVEEPHKLLKKKSMSLIHRHRTAIECSIRDPHIDSSILRTCRRVYAEGLPILYGDNVFMFTEAMGVTAFRDEQICGERESSEKTAAITTFNFEPCPHGRLSMIHRLEMKCGPNSRSWDFFFLGNRSQAGKSCVYFANLEWLVLDMRAWDVREDHFLVVQPFTAMFRSSLGLKTLVLLGIKNQRNIEELKCTLLRDGGELFPGLPPIQRQVHEL